MKDFQGFLIIRSFYQAFSGNFKGEIEGKTDVFIEFGQIFVHRLEFGRILARTLAETAKKETNRQFFHFFIKFYF